MITYTIDPIHSAADFKVRHLMVTNVRGEFSGVSGSLAFDPENPANSKVEAKIPTATIQTRDPQRDAHLKSADFFDVQQFPTVSFISTRVKRTGDGELALTGDLTIHGVTREVVFKVEGPTPPAKDPCGNTRIGLSAVTKINRKDFDLI